MCTTLWIVISISCFMAGYLAKSAVEKVIPAQHDNQPVAVLDVHSDQVADSAAHSSSIKNVSASRSQPAQNWRQKIMLSLQK